MTKPVFNHPIFSTPDLTSHVCSMLTLQDTGRLACVNKAIYKQLTKDGRAPFACLLRDNHVDLGNSNRGLQRLPPVARPDLLEWVAKCAGRIRSLVIPTEHPIGEFKAPKLFEKLTSLTIGGDVCRGTITTIHKLAPNLSFLRVGRLFAETTNESENLEISIDYASCAHELKEFQRIPNLTALGIVVFITTHLSSDTIATLDTYPALRELTFEAPKRPDIYEAPDLRVDQFIKLTLLTRLCSLTISNLTIPESEALAMRFPEMCTLTQLTAHNCINLDLEAKSLPKLEHLRLQHFYLDTRNCTSLKTLETDILGNYLSLPPYRPTLGLLSCTNLTSVTLTRWVPHIHNLEAFAKAICELCAKHSSLRNLALPKPAYSAVKPLLPLKIALYLTQGDKP